jgi:hypothetical protein
MNIKTNIGLLSIDLLNEYNKLICQFKNNNNI